MRIGYLINLLLNLAYAILNCSLLYSYFSSPKVSEAYSYGYVFIYLLLPLIIISILIFIAINGYLKSRRNLKKILYALFLLNILLTFGFEYLLQNDVNKIKVIVNNMTSSQLDNVKLFGRNAQYLEVGDILSGQSKEVYCDCRDVNVHSRDTLGLLIKYRLNNKDRKLLIVGSNENLFDEYKEIRIINDSLEFESHHYGNKLLWGRVDHYSHLLPWDSISKRMVEKK